MPSHGGNTGSNPVCATTSSSARRLEALFLRVHHVLEDGDSRRGDVARRPLHGFVQLQRLGELTGPVRVVPLEDDGDAVWIVGGAEHLAAFRAAPPPALSAWSVRMKTSCSFTVSSLVCCSSTRRGRRRIGRVARRCTRFELGYSTDERRATKGWCT